MNQKREIKKAKQKESDVLDLIGDRAFFEAGGEFGIAGVCELGLMVDCFGGERGLSGVIEVNLLIGLFEVGLDCFKVPVGLRSLCLWVLTVLIVVVL
jgi:hypothetical protein